MAFPAGPFRPLLLASDGGFYHSAGGADCALTHIGKRQYIDLVFFLQISHSSGSSLRKVGGLFESVFREQSVTETSDKL
jgi:hypothetical protein